MAEEEEDLIFGMWTKEEFVDDVVFSLFAALVGFITGMGFRFLSKYLAKQKWFKEKGE